MMKKYIIIPILALLTIMATGCEDYLEEEPKGFASSENLFNSTNGITQVLHGVYEAGRRLYRGRYYVMAFGITTDEITYLNSNSSRIALQNFVFTPDNDNLSRVWQANAYGIARANQIIEGIQDFPQEDFRKHIIAEAKFLRAWYYFSQVRAYGEVPLLTDFEKAELFPSVSTIPEIYAQIIADLQEAEQVLPAWQETVNERGRATRGAAKTLLGKVYLTMATTPETADPNLFNLAAAKLKEVIDAEGYGLVDEYEAVFWPVYESGPEDIFSYQFEPNTRNNNSIMADFSPNPDTYNQRGYKNFYVVPELYNMLEEQDARKELMIMGDYTAYHYNESGALVDSSVHVTTNGHAFTQKYQDPEWSKYSHNNHGSNLPLLRYADVLLMYSEAINETQGATADAYMGIDMVRARSNASTLDRGLSQEELRQAIRDERYLEFHGEGQRWFDLVRWGTLKENVEAVREGVTVDWPKHRFFPLPQNEVDANPNLNQNPDYLTSDS